MKVHPIATNHIIIETETGQLIDINDGGKDGVCIRSHDYQEEIPVVVQEDFRIILSFRKRKTE